MVCNKKSRKCRGRVSHSPQIGRKNEVEKLRQESRHVVGVIILKSDFEHMNIIGNAWIAVRKSSEQYDFVSAPGELEVAKNECTTQWKE